MKSQFPVAGSDAQERIDRFVRILRARGQEIDETIVLLDFGCGSGHLVKAALARGIDAYGCDVDFDQPANDTDVLAELLAAKRVREVEVDRNTKTRTARVIGLSPPISAHYRLPFDDGTFDVVISNQVLEHVDNYPDMAQEPYRVMKPGAVFLHMFPPPFVLLEGHTNIPLGGVFNPDWWLKIWAHMGVRMWHHKGRSASDTIAWTRNYLDTRVNYLSKRELIDAFDGLFDVQFVENELFRINPRARIFVLPSLYRHFRGRIMYGVRRSEDR